MSVEATVKLLLSAFETLDSTDAPDVANPELQHTDWNRTFSLNATSTPPVDTIASLELTGASGTIDLTALDQVAGTVDCTGKKLVALMLYNPNTTGRVVIDKGGTNGYPVNGDDQPDPLNVEPGGGNVCYMHDQFPAVSATVKTIDWSNGGSSAGQLMLLLG